MYPYNMILTFGFGYFFITLEHTTKVNKACIALLMAVVCWTIQFLFQQISPSEALSLFSEHLSNTAQVVLFLLGALTIVEMINSHKAFGLISKIIQIPSKRKMLWLVGFITFFLSSLLDNLTTCIVMITLLKKCIKNTEDRLLLGMGVVIAANAGGAWTPIGDVTTTMLWIGGQVTTPIIISHLFLPSLICFVVAFAILSLFLKGSFPSFPKGHEKEKMEPLGPFVFFLGIACLVFVPIFKILTGLPPFMAILGGLGLMWLITDLAHRKFNNRSHLRVPFVISKVDLSSAFFFLGILLTVDALSDAGILMLFAQWLDRTFPITQTIPIFIGLASAVVDNVPLVAATMRMYPLAFYPTDSWFWQLIAYCAGTGGSILVIGSAAGVAFMGMEEISFFDYLKKGGLAALVGFLAGIACFLLLFS